MSFRIAASLAAILVLAGCTDADWDHVMTFAGAGAESDRQQDEAMPVAATARPAPRVIEAASGPDPFCQSVALHDSQEQGFDPETQRRVLAQSYQQCLGLFGPGH